MKACDDKQTYSKRQMTTSETAVVVSVIGGLVSLTAALLVAWSAWRERRSRIELQAAQSAFQRELELLKSQLQSDQDENAARREYRFEAVKRLYRDAEPLLFEMDEACKSAIGHIKSLAREAAKGTLEIKPSPLSGQAYYFVATLYALLTPAAAFYLLRRTLTGFDLSRDPFIRRQYWLGDTIYRLFSRDFELAGMRPPLEYKPHDLEAPTVRQGAYIREVERAVEAMCIIDDRGSRLLTYSQFEDALNDNTSALRRNLQRFLELFEGFTPQTHPVTWRILVTQYFLMSAIRFDTRKAIEKNGLDPTIKHFVKERGRAIDIRAPFKRQGRIWDVTVAKNYLKKALHVHQQSRLADGASTEE